MSDGAPAIDPAQRERTMFRLGGSYLVNLARLVVRHVDADIITSLIFLAIGRANAIGVSETGAAVYPYLENPGVPDDSLRRPVSVYAVAKDLDIPYETVRRHVRRLVETGALQAVPGGLIAPAQALITPDAVRAIYESWQLTLDLVDELGDYGIGTPGELSPAGPEVGRRVVRLAVDYFLSATCDMARHTQLDVMSVLILRTISVGNVEHLTHDRAQNLAYGALDTVPDDDQRRPVSVFAVAKFLAIPYETARRHILKLVELGLVERRSKAGMVVPARVIASPSMLEATQVSNAVTTVFLERLARAGVGPQPGPHPRRSAAWGVRRP